MNFGRCLYGTVQNKEKLLNTTLKSGKERKQDNEKNMEKVSSNGSNSIYGHLWRSNGSKCSDRGRTGKVTVHVAYMPDYASLNGLISAIELGYFDDENIDVQLTEFSDGPTIIQAMESGSIDVGYIGQGAHKLCINGKADIFALAHVSNGDAVIGSKEKGTDTIEGLKGKTIAYSSGTSSEDILNKTLAKEV